jgi:hypothetical protein
VTMPEPVEERIRHLFAFELPPLEAHRMRTRVMSFAGDHQHAFGARNPRVRRRFGRGVLLAVAATLVFAAASIGALTLMERLAHDAGPGVRIAYEKATKLDISTETRQGKVTLDRAYADANRVLLAILVSNTDALDGVTLADSAGHEYLHGSGTGFAKVSEMSGYISSWTPPAPLAPGPLSFTVKGGSTEAQWSMSFELPVEAGAMVAPAQTSEAAGITVTLKTFTVSPTAISAELENSPLDADRSWAATWSIQHDGKEIGSNAASVEFQAEDQLTRRLVLDEGTDQSAGSWKLIVRELVGDNADGQVRIAGPWQFTIAIP